MTIYNAPVECRLIKYEMHADIHICLPIRFPHILVVQVIIFNFVPQWSIYLRIAVIAKPHFERSIGIFINIGRRNCNRIQLKISIGLPSYFSTLIQKQY